MSNVKVRCGVDYNEKKLNQFDIVNEMDKRTKKQSVIIFSESAEFRDFYRNFVLARFEKVFCFEKEVTCFDNLKTINPDVIILKTENLSVVWRFVYAIQAYRLMSSVLLNLSGLDREHLMDFMTFGLRVKLFDSKEELAAAIDNSTNLSGVDGITQNGFHKAVLVGNSIDAKYVRSFLPKAIDTEDPVLITGEPGVGKKRLVGIITEELKNISVTIKLDCKAFDLENKVGRGVMRRIADSLDRLSPEKNMDISPKVIVHLDGVDRLSEMSQLKLLLCLERSIKDTFANSPYVNTKIKYIASSDKNLSTLVQKGAFKKELYYRLNVIPIHLVPLRDRKEDVPLLVDFLLINACAALKTSQVAVSRETRQHLTTYDWPGNIDELETVIRRIAETRSEKAITKNKLFSRSGNKQCDLFLETINQGAIPDALEIKNSLLTQNLSLKAICEKFVSRTEKRMLRKALETTNWNRKKAAALLNISYKSMLNKIKLYEISITN